MLQMMVLLAVIALLPVALFLGLIGLAILIWSWKRIGPYFVNFGRWLGNWQNFIPLSVLGIISLILILVILPIVGLPRVLTVILLVLFALATFIIFQFALVAWTVGLSRWFWPRWRKLVWSGVLWMWDLVPGQRRRPSAVGPKPEAKGPRRRKLAVASQPRRASWLATFWAVLLGKPPEPAKPSEPVEAVLNPTTQPPKRKAPVKRSMLSNFWALMLGKPSKTARPKAAPVRVQTTEQSLGQSESIAATAKTVATTRVVDTSTSPKAAQKATPKRSGLGALWALMLGKPSKPGKPRPGPAGARTSEQAPGASETATAATAKTGATARMAKGATTPERAKREKPAKRGFFAGIWTSMVRGVTFVVGLVFLGVVWVVQKMREGIEWIRVRLNLD